MLIRLSIIIVICMLTGCATFDTHEKWLLAGNYMALAIDMHQTGRLIDDTELYETNRIVGQDKNKAMWFIGSQMILTHGVAYLLPEKYRKTFLSLCLGYTAKDIYRNDRIGVETF